MVRFEGVGRIVKTIPGEVKYVLSTRMFKVLEIIPFSTDAPKFTLRVEKYA